MKTLRVTLNIPVLVGIGDKDELFEIDKVKDFYNLVPGNKKGVFDYEQYNSRQDSS